MASPWSTCSTRPRQGLELRRRPLVERKLGHPPSSPDVDRLDLALPLLEEAAGGPVGGIVGSAQPIDAVSDAINQHGFDEIIVSTLSPRVSRWLKLDVPNRLKVLGKPITTVSAR